MMVRWVQILGAAALASALACPAGAQTAPASAGATPTIHARAARHAKKRHAEKPKPEGRQITVHKSTPSWLTLGTQEPVGYGNNYVTDTFDQPSPIANTNAGSRGRMGLADDNRFDGPGIPLIRF